MRATTDLLSNYQHVISSLTLVTGSKGIFDVLVDGEILYSKSETGRHAEPEEILHLFQDLIGPNVATYGSED